jgi:hypothetical protein
MCEFFSKVVRLTRGREKQSSEPISTGAGGDVDDPHKVRAQRLRYGT